jgi:hypothetical protein
MAVQQKEVYFEDMTLIDPMYPNVRVDLEWIGEGVSGDFDPDDPNDVPLLRFTVYRREVESATGWTQVSDASYCTNLPATAPRAILAHAIKRIYDEVAAEVEEDNDVKRLCENLSHISPDWFNIEQLVESFNQKCMETVADIAMTAGYMLAKGEIQIDNSREFVREVQRWAEDFNIVHLGSDWKDVSYIEAVDEYGESRLLEHYGVEAASERNGANDEMMECEHCGKMVEANGNDDFFFEVPSNLFPAPHNRSKGVCGECWNNQGYAEKYFEYVEKRNILLNSRGVMKMEKTNNVRGLSSWEFILLKEIISNRLSFTVNIKHHKEKFHGGAVTIKPTKNERYYWNKEQFRELRALLDSLGAKYNRVGVPETMVHSVFSNGFSYIKFEVDATNRLSFPGLVPNICVKHQRFDTRSAAEKFKEEQSEKLGEELFIGIHPKDGFVVYSASNDRLRMSDWVVVTKADTHKGDIWSKGDLGYR